ncbi:MAG: NAD(P)-dependent oxidoreductase [Leptolyngbyaceae bacterium]|nr:NAD(P)-dependent oxidoreductase [Leptolyngbyaceae bacterium]
MKKRVLVCGATGFIGRNVVEQLARRPDLEIVAVRHNRPEYSVDSAANPIVWHQADLRSSPDVSRVTEGVEVIIQAAATTSGAKDIVTRPYIHVTDNAVMNSYLLREAFEQKVKHLIFFSCTVMYQSSDIALKETDWDESTSIHPRYFGVGYTKVYIEKMLEFFSSISELRTTAIRHSNIYGPYDKYDLNRSHVFGATVTKAMTAEREIVVWGTGEEERDLLHVDDLVRFVEAAMDNQRGKYRLYNCGSGKKISIKNLVKKIVAASGKKLEIKHDLSQPTIKTSLFLDSTKATNEINWRPMVDLDEGIKRTVQWWKDNIDPTTLKEK